MVSIIIPCYNSELCLGRAVSSAQAQTHLDIEIILVDNNSTDGTFSLMQTFQKENPRKIKIFRETKKGAPAARNRGLHEAKGEWIQFLDADDEILPEKISRQLSCIVNDEAGIIIGNFVRVNQNNNRNHVEKIKFVKDSWSGLIQSRLGITSANLFLKRHLIAVDGWNENLIASQEYDLMFRMLKAGSNVAFESSFLTKVYRTTDSISKPKNKDKFEKILGKRIELRREIRDHLIEKGLFTKERESAFGKYVFTELHQNKYKAANFFNRNIKADRLNVPFILKVKILLKSEFRHYKALVLNKIRGK